MTFWIVMYDDTYYQFNTPPDLNDFPYYSHIKETITKEGTNIISVLRLQCNDWFDDLSCPELLDLKDLGETDIKKISLVKVSSDDVVNKELKTELKSLSSEDLQDLYEEISKIINKPFVNNSSELTPEKVREFLVTSKAETLSKLKEKGYHPLLCLFEALGSKEIYNILGSSNTIYSDIKNNIIKDIPIQELACRISNSCPEYIESLSKYLSTSAINIISKQQLKTISDVIDIIKKLTPYEIGSVISMLPIDKVNLLKSAVNSKLSCYSTSYNSEKKLSLIDKLKNNKLI